MYLLIEFTQWIYWQNLLTVYTVSTAYCEFTLWIYYHYFTVSTVFTAATASPVSTQWTYSGNLLCEFTQLMYWVYFFGWFAGNLLSCGEVQFVPSSTIDVCYVTCINLFLIHFLSFTALSNIPVGHIVQKKMTTATASSNAAAVDDEEEGWFTLIIAFKHRHTSLLKNWTD